MSAVSTSSIWTIYQPLIVGLGAVILATLGNVLLEWYREHLARKREAITIRRALIEELRAHREMFADSVSEEQRKNPGGGQLLIPIHDFTPIFDKLVDRIGALEADEISAIFGAYTHLKLSPKNLAVIGKVEQTDFSTWVAVDAKFMPVVDNMSKGIVAKIDAALEQLSD